MASGSNGDETETTDGRVTVVTFDLEETRYCVRAKSVVSVLGVTDETPLADASDPWDAGTTTVAGERVRVVDLPRIFESSLRTSNRVDDPRLLVFSETDGNGRHYGWLVDDVHVTRPIRTTSLESPHLNTSHVKGRLELADEEIIWLDERAIND